MSLTQIIEKIASDLASVYQPSAKPNPNEAEPPTFSAAPASTAFFLSAKSLVEIFPQNLLKGLAHRAGFFSTPDAAEAEPLQSNCKVTVSQYSLDFGSVKKNSGYTTRTFTIRNPNCCSVNYSITNIPTDFRVSPSAGSVSANSSMTITVTFQPTSTKYYSHNITVDPGSHSISLTGYGID